MAVNFTYVPIQTVKFSGQSSFTFTSIPQTYADLILVWNGTSNGLEDTALRFNSDTGSNYSWTRIMGNGTTASSSRSTNATSTQGGWNGSTMTNIVQIQNYSNSTTYKSALVRVNAPGDGYTLAFVDLWRSTAAITSLSVAPNGTSVFSTGSATLYGIASA